MKRIFDLVTTILLLIIFLPVILIVALLIRQILGSPVIFKQQRPGLNEKPFNLYKFRTMKEIRDEQGELLPDRERRTAFGEVIRTFSLDELPQLINVLKGELSLVGPRPLLMEYLSLYTKEQARRHQVKPGITGWAQVNGRNTISWAEKFKLDIWYIENQSLWLDIKILWITFYNIFRPKGAVKQGHVPMEKFKGDYKDEENYFNR